MSEDIREQYRIMAQIEANLKVKDATGFDKDEYKTDKPNAVLPPLDCGLQKIAHNNGSFPYDEPQLPFTRANRRCNKARNRKRASDLCEGVLVVAKASTSGEDRIVKCEGCPPSSEIYLKVSCNWATLVRCPQCCTVGPIPE